MELKITRCPTCHSRRIKRVKKNLRRTFKGQAYVVPNLEFEECPDPSIRCSAPTRGDRKAEGPE
jgi:hypothetical protein